MLLCVIIDNSQISFRFALSFTVSEISTFYIKMAKLAFFSKFRTHDLKVLSPNYEKAHQLNIGKIAAKFENKLHPIATDMLRTNSETLQAITIQFRSFLVGLKLKFSWKKNDPANMIKYNTYVLLKPDLAVLVPLSRKPCTMCWSHTLHLAKERAGGKAEAGCCGG